MVVLLQVIMVVFFPFKNTTTSMRKEKKTQLLSKFGFPVSVSLTLTTPFLIFSFLLLFLTLAPLFLFPLFPFFFFPTLHSTTTRGDILWCTYYLPHRHHHIYHLQKPPPSTETNPISFFYFIFIWYHKLGSLSSQVTP